MVVRPLDQFGSMGLALSSMTQLKPIQRVSLSDSVFEQLRDQIMSGEMIPGTALPAERKLCAILGVNRQAIREALKRLEQSRLISIQQGDVTRVLDFRRRGSFELLTPLLMRPNGNIDAKTARSVVEMRSALGPDIMRLCAKRAPADIRARMSELAESMTEAKDDVGELQLLSKEFWELAVEGCDNVAYRFALNTLTETYNKIFDVLTRALEDELTDVVAYRAIAAAIQTSDTGEAEQRTRALLQKGAQGLLELIDTLEKFGEES